VLQVPGAMDVTVEFTSLSKTYSMPGWRIGFAVGNERIIAALARVKSYLDYGAFTPIQVAATAALNGSDDCIREMRDIYRRRRDVLVESFGRAGWEVPPPRASMFAWAPIPAPFHTLGSVEFSTLLVEKAEVAVSPGIGFGEYGEGFVRIALVENEQRIRQAARNIRRFLDTGAEKLHNVLPLAKRG
jgi:alanine-synthesizing transaminase